MNDCYLNFLVSFRALFSLDVGANLVNSKQTIGIILPDLSLLGYAVPVESFGIGLFVILFAYLIIEYNVQLLSHEKFKIAMNMLHTAHTPLILLRNQLEELKTGNLPEPLSQQVEEALGYAECIIYCNRNIATLNKVNKRIPPKTSTVNLELSTYVTSIVNQCRAHANSRQIRLTVGECSDCVSCRINENIMTAALQHLINKMILISESGCCISINVTHTMNSWQLQISNNEIAGQRAGKMFPFIPIIFPVYGYSDLWTVRKIIRLHGGKITGCRHGKAATFQIVIPTDCHCQNQSCPVLKHMLTNLHPHTPQTGEVTKAISGEMGGQLDVFYHFKRGTVIGGKRGLKLHANFSSYYALEKEGTAQIGNLSFRDFSIDVEKQWTKSFKMNLLYSMQEYSPSYGANKATNLSNIFVADLQYKFTPSFSTRMELQYLTTKEDQKDWMAALLEINFAPAWSIYGSDMYNHGKEKIHYYNVGASYAKSRTRVALSYGRNREGYVCSGGVCRTIPKYTGANLTITTSF